MPRDGSGVFSLTQPARADGNTILASEYNSDRSEYIADANAARPVVAGGTGATGASAARTNLAVAGLADNNAFTGNCTHAGTETFNGAATFTAATIVPDATADTHAMNRQSGDARYLTATDNWSLTSDNTFSGGTSHAVSLTSGKSGIRILARLALDFADGNGDIEIDIAGQSTTVMNSATQIEAHSSATAEMALVYCEGFVDRMVKDSNTTGRYHMVLNWRMVYYGNSGGVQAEQGMITYNGTSFPSDVTFSTSTGETFINDTGAANRVRLWELP